MYSLLIDTHDTKVSFALFKDKELFDSIDLESNMKHSEIAMPSLVSLLSKHELKCQDLSELIVNIGPGSFTGVRIGVVIAKTIAYLLNIPIKMVNSIEMEAFSVETIKEGLYAIKEKNGYFVGKVDINGADESQIKYYSNKEYSEKYSDCEVNMDIPVDYQNIYKHLINRETTNSHLVNPIYIKQIEALKND